MPDSHPLFNEIIQQIVSSLQPQTIIDVGIGKGKIGQLCRQASPTAKISGFEVYQPFVEKYKENYNGVYESVVIADFREWIRQNSNWQADLIVFGDVLEHFFYSEVHDVIQFCLYRVKYLMAIWPTEYLQNDFDGNLEESHRSNFKLSDLARYPIRYYQCNKISAEIDLHIALIKGMIKG